MENEGVKLLNFGASPFAMRCRLALAVKDIKYEAINEDFHLMKTEKGWEWSKSELLSKMNPVHKLVPVLIHNGKSICESSNIIMYIDDVWKNRAPLFPEDPYEIAQVRFWIDFLNRKVYESGKMIMVTKGDEQEALKKEFIDSLKVMEELLGDKLYFGGEDLNAIDVNFIPFYTWFYTYEKLGNFKVEDSCAKLVEWARRCFNMDVVSECLYDQHKIYEFMLEAKEIISQ